MPLYLYVCRQCQTEVELVQRVSERVPPECEKCGGKTEQALAPTTFILKGGGWSKDGYGPSGGGGE